MSHSEVSCDVVNQTTRFDPTGGEYNGIPFNLIVNSVGWLVLLILFTIFRKIAWDYGRIALVSRAEERSQIVGHNESGYNVWTSLFYGDHDNKIIGSQESLDTHLHSVDKGCCSWIPAFIKVKDADILKKCGRDALQYLSFQRYLLIYTTIICVLSVAIVVPVNFTGNNIGNKTDFGHTTIGNLDPDSRLLWIHAVLAVLFLIILVGLMRHFKMNLYFEEAEKVSRTLMISEIPKEKCFKNIIMQHFQEAYPEEEITDVQFAYNISKLVKLDQKRNRAAESRMNSQLEYEKTNIRPLMYPYVCGQCCCSPCCGCHQVDAIDHYTSEENKYREQCEAEKATAYQDPLGIAFVTFQSDAMTERVRADFRLTCKGAHNPQPSSVYRDLKVDEWRVKFAPSPENIYWENLAESGWKWWTKIILVNVFVMILLFFFTTPLIIINNLNEIQLLKPMEEHSPVLVQFLPTLLLWTFSALLPNVVYYTDQYVGHWTRTSEHHNVMVKTFIFLLLMVLILPSLGLTSASALFQWFVMDKEKSFRWRCIFLTGNGAFFVNYVITAAFIGSALELIRFSELFIYALKLSLSHSTAEKTSVRKAVVWEFQFGTQYAWMLCVFAVIMAYSIPCPLVAPFGLVYMGLKHLVDRYNIYFAYKPSKINKRIHNTAINFVVIAVILLQCNVVFFTALRAEGFSPVFVFSAVALFITLVIFVGRGFFGWFKNLTPLKYRTTSGSSPYDEEQFGERDGFVTPPEDTNVQPFVASVLLDKSNAEENGTQELSTYGAVEKTSSSPDYGVQ